MSELTRLYRESHLGKRMPAYDGRKSLYTAGPLPFESEEFVVKLDQDSGAQSSTSKRYVVVLEFPSMEFFFCTQNLMLWVLFYAEKSVNSLSQLNWRPNLIFMLYNSSYGVGIWMLLMKLYKS